MSDRKMNIVIVGGSLAGLFSGVVLKRLGHNVRILERSPDPLMPDRGAGIVVQDHVREFFDAYDATTGPYGLPAEVLQYLDREGNVVSTVEYPLRTTSWDLLYYRLRANFDGLPSDYCDSIPGTEGRGMAVYDHGHTALNLEIVNGKVRLQFTDRSFRPCSINADLVVAADGPSSSIRGMLAPHIKRNYVGYVAWRGKVPEHEVTAATRMVFGENVTFFRMAQSHILLYTIPGNHGSVAVGERLLNWVWYCNYPESSEEFKQIMVDKMGRNCRGTLHMGQVREGPWQQQKALARETLPWPFVEVVEKTAVPLIQEITDVASPQASFCDGQVVLVGDALAGFRPHAAASTNQAALNAMLLGRLVQGEITLAQWERASLEYAATVAGKSIAMGNAAQFGAGLPDQPPARTKEGAPSRIPEPS